MLTAPFLFYWLSQYQKENGWNPVLVDTECLSECASASELLWRAKAGVAVVLRHAGYNTLPHSPGQLARCLAAGAQTLPGSFKRGSILYWLSQSSKENGLNPVLVDTECLSECASASELLWRAKAGVAVVLRHAGYNTLSHSPGQLARCLTAGAQTLPGSFKRGSILYWLNKLI